MARAEELDDTRGEGVSKRVDGTSRMDETRELRWTEWDAGARRLGREEEEEEGGLWMGLAEEE